MSSAAEAIVFRFRVGRDHAGTGAGAEVGVVLETFLAVLCSRVEGFFGSADGFPFVEALKNPPKAPPIPKPPTTFRAISTCPAYFVSPFLNTNGWRPR